MLVYIINQCQIGLLKLKSNNMSKMHKMTYSFIKKYRNLIKVMQQLQILLVLIQIFYTILYQIFYKNMGKLITLIILLIISIQSKSFQKGSWTKQQYTNSSFLFNFLEGQSGYAYFTIIASAKYLIVDLWDQENGKSSINLFIWMETTKFMTDASFHIYQKHIQFSFHHEDSSTTYGEQEISINQKLNFNITYIPRKTLELKSVQGTFTINAIDLQQISPYIYEKIWLLLVIIPAIFFVTISNFFTYKRAFRSLEEIVGTHSLPLLWASALRYTYCLWDQTFYLSDTIGVSFLSIMVLVVCLAEIIVLCASIVACNHDIVGLRGQISLYFFAGAHIMGLFIITQIFFSFLSVIKLWFLLLPFILYQVWKLGTIRIKKNSQKVVKIVSIAYSLPTFILPLFAVELNYPQSEVHLWWLYAIFFIIQASCYLLRINGGLNYKAKKIMFRIRRCCSSQEEYQTLQESMCPLCFKQVQVSEVNMAAAGDSQQVDWLKAPCNHYFHRQCLINNMEYIDRCYFDGNKWPIDFTKLIPHE